MFDDEGISLSHSPDNSKEKQQQETETKKNNYDCYVHFFWMLCAIIPRFSPLLVFACK